MNYELSVWLGAARNDMFVELRVLALRWPKSVSISDFRPECRRSLSLRHPSGRGSPLRPSAWL
eukprot:scaffold35842_cov36-Phaeocystis_antarctica.AAC.1